MTAAANVVRFGQSWLATAKEMVNDIQHELACCYQCYGVTSGAELAADHPHRAAIQTAEEAATAIASRLLQPQQQLETLASTLNSASTHR